jgi:hypothetical protein
VRGFVLFNRPKSTSPIDTHQSHDAARSGLMIEPLYALLFSLMAIDAYAVGGPGLNGHVGRTNLVRTVVSALA